MGEWNWVVGYNPARVLLQDRTTAGELLELAGGGLLGFACYDWPWLVGLGPRTPVNLGTAAYRSAELLLDAAERRTKTLVEIPVTGELCDRLAELGIVELQGDR